MAVPTFHITDADSGIYAANFDHFALDTPGTLLMDADAWLVSPGSTLIFSAPLTATINGRITSSNFSGGGNAGIYVHTASGRSSIIIGTTGEVTGYNEGIFSDTQNPTDIINKGRIVAVGPSGRAIYYHADTQGNFTINNSGSIVSSFHGIELTGAGGDPVGTHTIINSGIIDAPTAILFVDSTTVEKVTNSGLIHGDVLLGQGADIFTDFIKVKKHGKVVTHHGTVDGIIDLGTDNDTFNGGNNAEKVNDGQGADIYKLSGGNDTLLAAPDLGLDGVDTIDGGAGRDTYDGSTRTGTFGGTDFLINLDKIAHSGIAANSIVFAAAGLQTDHIFNFEDVIGSPGSDIIYGNASANHLVGGDASAGVVHDELFGLGGNDVLETTADNSQLFGGDGNDTLRGAGSGSIFDGGNGNDILEALSSRSDMYGGAGADIMTEGGFSGVGPIVNFFRYKALSDSGVTAATRDEITNFLGGPPGTSRDLIDLSPIDAIPGTKGVDDDFTFIGQAKWGHHAGELRYVFTADQTIVEADVNGDAKVDFSIALDGHHTLAATDFIL